MGRIADNLQAIITRVEQLAQNSGRPVTVVVVSKMQSSQAIREAHTAGQIRFAENYVQEALGKMAQLSDLPIEWHFIGPLQSNKTRPVAESFAWVQSVDREKIANRLSESRPASLPALNVCVQVNISGEATKSGVVPDQAESLAQVIAGLPRLKLRGLMTIAAPGLSATETRRQFRAMRELFENLQKKAYPIDTLSMGMTQDLELAIDEGATLVRVGSAVFGDRQRPRTGAGHSSVGGGAERRSRGSMTR
jgi:PLP dependent protein